MIRPPYAYRPPPYLKQALDAQGAATGWTTPAITYEKMRQMEAATAAPLGRDIDRNVSDPAFRAAWEAWYVDAWRPYYDKYAGPNASELAKLGAALHSDDIASRAESFRQQLESFYGGYKTQRDARGLVVPPTAAAPPVLGGLPPGAGQSGISLPWWAWVIGIGAVGALGYVTVRAIQDINRTRRHLEQDVVPGLLDASVPGLGTAYGKAKGRK